MKMRLRVLTAVAALTMFGCASSDLRLLLETIQVHGFKSADPHACNEADLPGTPEQVTRFFGRARIVTAKDIHDDYQYAPCFVFGSASRASQSCNWKIQAGMTAEVRCGDEAWLLACGDCEDLF